MKKGFTLAEVLITLGIIGVVAALTIPPLVKNYQNTQYSTGLKKAYTQMSQVLLQMAVDAGTPEDISSYFDYTGNVNTSITASGDKIASYYKINKNCKISSGGGCFADYNEYFDGTSTTTTPDTITSNYKFITNDGISIFFGFYNTALANANCKFQNSGITTSPLYKSCGVVYFDINGPKPPNYKGRDIFEFFITSNNAPLLYPTGGKDNSWWNNGGANRCSATSTGGDKDGIYCTGRVMEKGWVIDY